MLEVEKYMKEALKQAKKAYDKEEIPICFIIIQYFIISVKSDWWIVKVTSKRKGKFQM